MIVPGLLGGGVGSRLWPVSRKLLPKQFLCLMNDDSSLMQDTWKRVAPMPQCAQPIVVCNEEHRFLAAEQLRDEMREAGLTTEWVPFRGGHEIPMPVLEGLGRFLSTIR